jgi:hypothetical protein
MSRYTSAPGWVSPGPSVEKTLEPRDHCPSTRIQWRCVKKRGGEYLVDEGLLVAHIAHGLAHGCAELAVQLLARPRDTVLGRKGKCLECALRGGRRRERESGSKAGSEKQQHGELGCAHLRHLPHATCTLAVIGGHSEHNPHTLGIQKPVQKPSPEAEFRAYLRQPGITCGISPSPSAGSALAPYDSVTFARERRSWL